MAKYFVSKTEVLIVDGRIVGHETPLTRPCDKEQAIEGLGRYRRIGIENIHLCKHTTKRYSKLIREYNKRRKEVLAVAWCVIDYNIKCACHTKLKQERK